MNFPGSQKFLCFKSNFDSDSSLTDQNIAKCSKIPRFGGFLDFPLSDIFRQKSNGRYGLIRALRHESTIGMRFLREINNFCKMNFSDSQKKCPFKPQSDMVCYPTSQNPAKTSKISRMWGFPSKISTFWGFPWFSAKCHFFGENRILGTALFEHYDTKAPPQYVFWEK